MIPFTTGNEWLVSSPHTQRRLAPFRAALANDRSGVSAPKAGGWHERLLRTETPLSNGCEAHDLHHYPKLMGRGVMLRGRRGSDQPAAAGGDKRVDNIDLHALTKAEARRPSACGHMHFAPGPDS